MSSVSLRSLRVAALSGLGAVLFMAFAIQCGGQASSGSGAASSGSSPGSGGSGGGSTASSASSAGGGGATGTGGASSSTSTASGSATASSSSAGAGGSDPAPTSCDAGGIPPPPPDGSAACPSDKNLPGCPCPSPGATAACWTGPRAERGHGTCQDGMTTCNATATGDVWGACDGEVLPTTGGSAKAACGCFTTGRWAIQNVQPCFITTTDANGNMVFKAIATDLDVQCPSSFSAPAFWSTDTLEVDCAGTFTLCYTLKAGDPKNPQPSDCAFATSCTAPTHYVAPGVQQTLPDLPGWETTTSAQATCAQQFSNGGGYGEMTVTGQSDECELVNRTLQIVTYCPLSCAGPHPPAACTSCQPGGGGPF